MMFKAVSALMLATTVLAANPHVFAPNNMTYQAGEVMEIKWGETNVGFVNIDLVDIYSDVLQFPIMIAAGVPAANGKYSWKIPSNLKTAAGYSLRVWGNQAPAQSGEGTSNMFTILNNIPNAVNTFTVTSPNKDSPCAAGSQCVVSWDYPLTGNYPAAVDIALYSVGSPNPLLNIATVSAAQKSYTWNVPSDANLLGANVYVGVSGSGSPLAGPGMSNDMGANSQAFVVSQASAAASKDENKDKKEDKKVEKKTEKKPEPPKVSGASKKEKNAASTIQASVTLLAALALPIALLL
jgi:hypothetical protein